MRKLGYRITVLALISGIITTLYMAFTDIGFAIGQLQNEPLGNIGGAVIIIELITIAVILVVLAILMALYKKGFLIPLVFVLAFGWLFLQLRAAENFVQYFALAIVCGSALSFVGSFFKIGEKA